LPDIVTPSVPVLELVARTALVYVMFVAALRVWGKRELGQFTTFDLALLLLAANALQPAITGPDTSVGGAAVIIATIFVLNGGVAFARRRSGLAQRVLTSEPTILARDGAWDESAVDRENLGQEDLDAALREHGIETVAEARLVVLEEDGSISVVARESDAEALRRRRRRSRRI
jgi:uncharacterized membrane protein YcaP (DUF421 family)